MKLGKIIGRVWAERKVKQLHACQLHIIQPVTSDLKKNGQSLVVADPKHIAGPNDIVVYVTSTDAAQTFDSGFAPVNASVVELVDSIY